MVTNFKNPIEDLVDRLFGDVKAKRGECCVLPVTGARIVWGIDPIAPEKKKAISALRARDWLAVNGPPDAPVLPLSSNDVEDYRHARGLKGVVGFYARSLARQGYDVRKHPSFDDFARGLVASNSWLWGIEQDVELRRRFPPRPLTGMTPGLYWAPPKEYEETMASYARSAELARRSAQSGNVEVIAAAPGG
jgi:hypothetical protein